MTLLAPGILTSFKSIQWLKCSLTLSILLLASIFVQANNMKLVFADYKPYSWQGDSGEAKGLEIDILTEALHNRMNINLTFEILPWARAQHYVRDGKADGFVAVPTQKRKTYTQASKEPLTHWGASIFTRSFGDQVESLQTVKDPEDLAAYKLAAMIGNGWVAQNLKKQDILWVATMEQLINVTASKRVDALVDSSVVIDFYQKEMGLKSHLIEVKSITSSNLYLCIGLKSHYLDILPEFDRVMKEMRNDGTLDKILNKYK